MSKLTILDLHDNQHLISEVAKLHEATWKNYYIMDRVAMYQARSSANQLPKTFIVILDNRVVGAVSLFSDFIKSLIVHPDFRNRGIGQALVNHCVNYAHSIQIETLHLFTKSAVDYYKKFGWQVVEINTLDDRTLMIISTKSGNQL